MSPDVVLLSCLTLAVTIGWVHRRYLDSSAPEKRPTRSKQPVVRGREVFGESSAAAHWAETA